VVLSGRQIMLISSSFSQGFLRLDLCDRTAQAYDSSLPASLSWLTLSLSSSRQRLASFERPHLTLLPYSRLRLLDRRQP
jgi:hypothetical protein